MNRLSRFALVLALVATSSACALSLRNPHVSDLQRNPGRYENHSVSIDGVVTSSWGVPMMSYYKVDDGTGEVTVLSQGLRVPARGSRVRVKGLVNEVAVLGGRSVGLHLREQDLYVKR